jgi:hypothetical protein
MLKAIGTVLTNRPGSGTLVFTILPKKGTHANMGSSKLNVEFKMCIGIQINQHVDPTFLRIKN